MAIFVIGGTGFIGIRVIPRLVALGESVVCMDINPTAPSLAGLGDNVSVIRGDVTQFDDVISVMEASKADRVINLSYNLGQDLPPHRASPSRPIGDETSFMPFSDTSSSRAGRRGSAGRGTRDRRRNDTNDIRSRRAGSNRRWPRWPPAPRPTEPPRRQ